MGTNDVFDGNRETRQRGQLSSAGIPRVPLARRREGAFPIDPQKRMDLAIKRIDVVETRANEVAGRDLAPSQPGEEFGRGKVDQDAGSVSMTGGTLKYPSW